MNEEEIFDIEVPNGTMSYKPVSHKDIIQITESYLNDNGLHVSSKSYSISRGGDQLMAYWRIGGSVSNHEMAPMIGFRNSYDKSMSLGYGVGNQVFICSNGMVRADMGVLKRKHVGTIQIELKDNIIYALDKLVDNFEKLTILSNNLKEVRLDTKDSAELLGRMYIEKNILSPTELNIIKRELEEPTFSDFEYKNAWSLYNHCTYSLKQAHPLNSFKKHMEVTKFFEEEVLI